MPLSASQDLVRLCSAGRVAFHRPPPPFLHGIPASASVAVTAQAKHGHGIWQRRLAPNGIVAPLPSSQNKDRQGGVVIMRAPQLCPLRSALWRL